MSKCCWPGCELEGVFSAPCDPRDLSKRQYFCKQHIKDFNKSWNGLTGFDEEEIFSMQHGAATWNRPTWTMGVNSRMGQTPFETAEDLYRFFKQRQVDQAKIEQHTLHELPADVQEACHIFQLQEPIGGRPLKQRYLKLVKEHHPDVHPEKDDAAEYIKKINVAYRILESFSHSA